MDIKFHTEDGRVLDLTGQNFSVNEKNSRLGDGMFTSYSFPFEIYMDEEFKRNFGDFESFDSYNLDTVINGYFEFREQFQQAKLEFSDIEGSYITGQIDYGFEELPNHNKKLNELPLEKFSVDDIHIFAAQTAAKIYPETNFTFPRLYLPKYTPDQKVWDAFNGYVNDLNDEGNEMRRNYIDTGGEIYNVNIVHPLVNPIYLLKAGFEDADLILKGDILSDVDLRDTWIYSGTEYFTSKQQRRFGISINSFEYDWLQTWKYNWKRYEAAHLQRYVTLEKVGKYKIAGPLKINKAKNVSLFYELKLNGNIIWSLYEKANRKSYLKDIYLNIDFNVTKENSELELRIRRHIDYSQNYQVCDLLITSDALSDIINQDTGEDSGVITNPNEIDLTRAVPDMTFGEYLDRLRKLLAYSTDIVGKEIWMNKIGDKEPGNIKHFERFEVEKPRRKRNIKKSFLLRLAPWENNEKPDSIFFSKDGVYLNKEPEDETTVIEIDAYMMPVLQLKPQGHITAVVKKFDATSLQLVRYSGLKSGQNNAESYSNLSFPNLFYNNHHKRLKGRIESDQYEWEFKCKPSELKEKVIDFLSCYQNIHETVEWTIDIVDDSFEVSIITETRR